MQNKKTLNIVIVLILLLNIYFVSGLSSLGTFKINTCVQLKQTCGNCTSINITSVIYPNSSMALGQVDMIKNGSEYYYSFCNNTVLGSYIVNGLGNPDGTPTVFVYNYEITPTGYQTDTPQSIVIFFIFGVMIIIGLLFFIFGLRTGNIGIKLFCLSMTVIIMVFLIGYIINLGNISLGQFPSLTNGFNALYILFVALLTVGAVGLIVYLIAFSFEAFYKSRGFRD